MRTSACRWSGVVLPLLVFMVTFSAQPALAHIVKTGWIMTHRSTDICVKQTTELNHSSTYRGGHFVAGTWAETFSRTGVGTIPCSLNEYTKHRLHMRAYKWTQNNEWGRCFIWPTKWTGKTWYEGWARGAFVRQRRFVDAPCKPGNYSLNSIGGSMHGADWYGGRWIRLKDHTHPYWHWMS